MQGHSNDEKNPQDSNRQRQEQPRVETSLQIHIQDQDMQNNLRKELKKKEITHQPVTSQDPRRKAHYDQQDNEEDNDFHPLKKLHSETSQEKSLVEIPHKDSQEETETRTTEKINLDKVYASFEKLASFKNTLENIHPINGVLDPNILKYHPEDFKIPPQDLKNIEDFILSYPTDILTTFQGFYSIKTESEKESNSNTEEDSDDEILSNSSAFLLGRCSSEVPPEF